MKMIIIVFSILGSIMGILGLLILLLGLLYNYGEELKCFFTGGHEWSSKDKEIAYCKKCLKEVIKDDY